MVGRRDGFTRTRSPAASAKGANAEYTSDQGGGTVEVPPRWLASPIPFTYSPYDADAVRRAEMQALQDQLFAILEAMLRRVSESDDLLNLAATMHRRFFLALCRAAFTEEQAIQIVAHQSFSANR